MAKPMTYEEYHRNEKVMTIVISKDADGNYYADCGVTLVKGKTPAAALAKLSKCEFGENRYGDKAKHDLYTNGGIVHGKSEEPLRKFGLPQSDGAKEAVA